MTTNASCEASLIHYTQTELREGKESSGSGYSLTTAGNGRLAVTGRLPAGPVSGADRRPLHLKLDSMAILTLAGVQRHSGMQPKRQTS
jgi:hypothetical protein